MLLKILKEKYLFTLFILLLFLSDYLSKWFATLKLQHGYIYDHLPIIKFVLAYNQGVAFSLFSSYHSLGKWLLIGFTSAILIFLFHWDYQISKQPKPSLAIRLSLNAMIAGTIGNLYERIHFGQVTDFITLELNQWHWPTIFNLADIYITFGALTVAFCIFRSKT